MADQNAEIVVVVANSRVESFVIAKLQEYFYVNKGLLLLLLLAAATTPPPPLLHLAVHDSV